MTNEGLSFRLPDIISQGVKESLADWSANQKVEKLWTGDESLWTNNKESKWLGWLSIVDQQLERADEFEHLAAKIRAQGISDVVLLGMGGSSLCPEVMKLIFGHWPGFPELHVLDSTDPAQIRSLGEKINPANTFFIVSSKSGSTLEPNILKQYFLSKVAEVVGSAEAGRRFIAITDPGSQLEKVAAEDKFRSIFYGVPSVGGRYSALSDFGLIPSTVLGLDVRLLLEEAKSMAERCRLSDAQNPALLLGTILGVCATHGQDKVTLVTSPELEPFGAWLEQLMAESTGKNGRGLIPVDREGLQYPIGGSINYSTDRVFVYIRLSSSAHGASERIDATLRQIGAGGYAVVTINVTEKYEIGAEFFRWEFATAVAGAIIGINPFDQPDVEASKIATRELTDQYEKTGRLPTETPFFSDAEIDLYSDERNASELLGVLPRYGNSLSLAQFLKAHLNRLGTGDYFAILAFIEMNDRHTEELQKIRRCVRDRKRVATCLGFGPRFLHSTGQAYKGGPNSGVFLQVTCHDAYDLSVPNQGYTFGIVKAAQARGDFTVLAERGRRALRVHLKNVDTGLANLRKTFEQI